MAATGLGHVAIEVAPLVQEAAPLVQEAAAMLGVGGATSPPAPAPQQPATDPTHLSPPSAPPTSRTVGTPNTGRPHHGGGATRAARAVTDSIASPMSKLAKLQTYLPTGTWITFTALQTWAFSIRPDEPPPISDDPAHQSNCNSHQRIALAMVIALGVVISFGASFIKTFVMDKDGQRIQYPGPSGASVPHEVTDQMTGVRFPCHTQHKYLWPVANASGQFVRDGRYLKVMVFRQNIEVYISGGSLLSRMRNMFADAQRNSTLVAQTDDDDPAFKADFRATPNSSIDTFFDAQVPQPTPQWKFTIRGPQMQYLDFSHQVWLHALVSVGAFAVLALFSTQVTKCIYPSIPDYLPGVLQTALLAGVSFLAAYVVDDQTVSAGQAWSGPQPAAAPTGSTTTTAPPTAPPTAPTTAPPAHAPAPAPVDPLADVPAELHGIIEGTLWVRTRTPPAININEKRSSAGTPAPTTPPAHKAQ